MKTVSKKVLRLHRLSIGSLRKQVNIFIAARTLSSKTPTDFAFFDIVY